MKTEELYQVNVHYDLVDDDYSADIIPFDSDGYQGRTTDTVYEDGISFTDWCCCTGSYEECEEYIDEFMLVNGKE